MKKVVFDVETKNTFLEVGSNNSSDLDISIVGIYDSEIDAYHAYEEHEFKYLWPIFEKADLLIGFNSDHFDIPLLNKYYPGDLTQIKSVDLLKEIKSSYGRRMKLDQVAEGTLGLKKSGHGLEAITWWKNGEIEKIKKYCLDDVRLTKDLYEYARMHRMLKFKEGGKIIPIPLSTDGWETKKESPLTFSLPF